MMAKKTVVNKDKLTELIIALEADLPKLEMDESYQIHDPTYYNYVIYYEDLVETLIQLGGRSTNNVSFFSTYLVSLLAYQVMELQKPLHEAVRLIINELKIKQELLEQQVVKKDEDDSDDTPKFDA